MPYSSVVSSSPITGFNNSALFTRFWAFNTPICYARYFRLQQISENNFSPDEMESNTYIMLGH